MTDFIYKIPIEEVNGEVLVVEVFEEQLYNLKDLLDAYIHSLEKKKRIKKAIHLTRKELEK